VAHQKQVFGDRHLPIAFTRANVGGALVEFFGKLCELIWHRKILPRLSLYVN
jgi:hypothetical protein